MASLPYDITLAVSGGSTYGFMLVSPKDQSKILDIDEAPPAPEKTSDESDHKVFGGQLDQSVAQIDFSGGLGQLEAQDRQRYWWGTAVTHVPGKVYCPPPVNTLTLTSGAAATTNFRTWVSSAGTRYDFTFQSTRLYRRDASNTTNAWTLVYTASAAITDVHFFGGAAYICVPTDGTTTDFFYQPDPTAAATWVPTNRNHTAFSTVLGKPKFFAHVRGTMYAAVDSQKVFYNTDPTADSWTGPIDTSLAGNYSGPPGDTSYGFRGMVAVNDFIFVFKDDAGYSIDSQQEVQEVFWQWRDRPSSKNFAHFAPSGDLLYYSVSPEVYAYDPNTGRNLPTRLAMMDGVSVEDILGVGADNRYVYVLAKVRVPLIRSSSSACLFRGVRVSATYWAWEALWEDTSVTAYSKMYASPDGAGTRVYWGLDAGTGTRHMDIPANWDESTGSSFATSATLYTSVWRSEFEALVKRYLWLGARVAALDASNTIALAYSTDFGATFTTLATLTSAGLSFNDFTAITGDHMVLRFTFTCAGTATPVLRMYDLHARARWRRSRIVSCAVRICRSPERLNGTRVDSETAQYFADALDTLRTSNSTITYTDYIGRSFAVSLEKVHYHATRHEKPEDAWEQEALLTLAEASSGA